MQKLSLLPLLLVTGIGAVWASTLMFPNTTEFPRSPGGAGTISGALAFFDPTDGTATNTDKLNGVTASGYLQNRDCSTEVINKIWVGVDASGRAICGTRGVLIGYLTEGTSVSITRGASPSTAISIGDPLYAGDIVSTTSVGTGMITFTDDLSVLRLDTSTVVELSIGQLSGQSVAQAILTDGRLWGRILTSTGVNLGGGGLVAGVRGTSVSIERPVSTGPYVISVIDSIRPLDAATLSAIDGISLAGVPLTLLHAGSQISVYPTTPNSATSPTSYIGGSSPSITKTTLLTNSPWIRDNTRADIDYLYQNRSVSSRVLQEYNVTMPSSVTNEVLDALCPNITSGANTINQIYWNSLIGTSLDKCRDSRLVAFADYTKQGIGGAGTILPAPLYTSGSAIGVTSGGGTWSDLGYNITTIGNKIEYPILGLSLAGKTITITVGTLPNSTTSKTLVDFGGGLRIKTIAGGGYSCLWSGSNCVTVDSTLNTLAFTVPSTITAFVIGNNISTVGGLTYNTPIGVTIKNIQISN